MEFLKTKLEGSFIVQPKKIKDKRGFYCRVWDSNISKKLGLQDKFIQSNIVSTKKKGTLRGMHFQKNPFEESKLVRCTQGKIFDVIIDLRKESSTYKKWINIELSSDNLQALYIPEGFAHGFQTLEDNCEVCYHMSNWFSPEHAKGIRYDDDEFKIKWPIITPIISKKDLSYQKEEYIREV